MKIELSSGPLVSVPGEPLKCTIAVTNSEDRPVSATVRLRGVPTADGGMWSLTIPANETARLAVDIVMPLGSPGGTHPFHAEVFADSGSTAVARGEVEVRDAHLIELSLSPRGVYGNWRSEISVEVHNRTDEVAELELEGGGEDQRVRVRFDRKKVSIDPGEFRSIPTLISSMRPWSGDPQVRHFSVTAHGASMPLRARGTFRQTAVFDRNLSRLTAVLVVFSLWAVAAAAGFTIVTGNDTLLRRAGLVDETQEDPDSEGGGTESASDPSGSDEPGADGPTDPASAEDASRPSDAEEFTPEGTPRVTGLVKDADGNGLAGAVISLEAASIGSRRSSVALERSFQTLRGKRLGPLPVRAASAQITTISGDDGSYTVPVARPGAYYVDFRMAGFDPSKHIVVFGEDMAPVGLNLTLQQATGSVKGVVSPAGRARVRLSDGVVTYETAADPVSGAWTMEGVSVPGEYVLTVSLPTGESYSEVVSIGADGGGVNGIDTGTSQIPPGGGSLSGYVCDANGRDPIAGATVTLNAGGDAGTFVTTTGTATDSGTEGGGLFAINGLPADLKTFDLVVSADGYGTTTVQLLDSINRADCIQLTRSTGSLTGTVKFDPLGPNTSGISVLASSATAQFSTTVSETVEGSPTGGTFSIDRMPPGEYTVVVSRPDIGTVVREVRIVPPTVSRLDFTVTQVNTNASLSSEIKFIYRNSTKPLRSSVGGAPFTNVTLTLDVPGVDVSEVLTKGIDSSGLLEATAKIPLGQHRISLAAKNHETEYLTFFVTSPAAATVDLATMERAGTKIKFDGEIRQLASFDIDFVSGLDPANRLETKVTLKKVIPGGSEAARGLDGYSNPPVDAGTTNQITIAAFGKDDTKDLTTRIPSGSYTLDIEAPPLHWAPTLGFAVDLRAVSGATPITWAGSPVTTAPNVDPVVAFDAFPQFDLTLNSTATTPQARKDLVNDPTLRILRLPGSLTKTAAEAKCTATIPDADGSGPETDATARMAEVSYKPLPTGTNETLTMPGRAVESGVDSARKVTVWFVVCRGHLQPVATKATGEANKTTPVSLTLNPATGLRLFWDDWGVRQYDFLDKVKLTVASDSTITFIAEKDAAGALTGRFRTGQVASGSVTITIDPGYPGYKPPPDTTVAFGVVSDLELETTPVELQVPTYLPLSPADPDHEVVVTAQPTNDLTKPAFKSSPQQCSPGAGLNECTAAFGSTATGLELHPPTFPWLPQTYSLNGLTLADDEVLAIGGTLLRHKEGNFLIPPKFETSTSTTGPWTQIPPSGAVLLANGRTLMLGAPGALLKFPILDLQSLPRGSYLIDLTGRTTTTLDHAYAPRTGTVRITPDYAGGPALLRADAAVYGVYRPELTIRTHNQATPGVPVPQAGDDVLSITWTQDGVPSTIAKATADDVKIRVQPSDLATQIGLYDAATPATVTGTTPIPLKPAGSVSTNPGKVTITVDPSTGFTPLHPTTLEVDPTSATRVVDSSAGSVDFRLLRLGTIAFDVSGAEKPADALIGAKITLALDPAVAGEELTGEFFDGTTWQALALTAGSTTEITIDNNPLSGTLRSIRSSCPTATPSWQCITPVKADISHPDYDPQSVTITPAPGAAITRTINLNSKARDVALTFAAEGRALIHAHVCVTATPATGFTAPPVHQSFPVGGTRDVNKTYPIPLLRTVAYQLTAVASSTAPVNPSNPCPAAAGTDPYTSSSTTALPARDTAAPPIEFDPRGAVVTGEVAISSPGGSASLGWPTTHCTDCITVSLFQVGGNDELASTKVKSDGTFVLNDSVPTTTKRVLPTGCPNACADRMYELRFSGPDIVPKTFAPFTLTENAVHAVVPTLNPPAFDLEQRTHTVTVDTADNKQVTFTGAGTWGTHTTNCETTPAVTCASGVLLPKGTYTVKVTDTAGTTTFTPAEMKFDGTTVTSVDIPAIPDPNNPPTSNLEITLGYDVTVTVTDKDGTEIQGATVRWGPGVSKQCIAVTDANGSCLLKGVPGGASVTVDGMSTKGNPKTTAGTNTLAIEAREPTITIDAPGGTFVRIGPSPFRTCTVGTDCPITLSAAIAANSPRSLIASLDGTVYTLPANFEWKDTRAFTLTVGQFAARTRVVTLKKGGVPVANKQVFFVPRQGQPGVDADCTTDNTGTCTMTGLYISSYDAVIDSTNSTSSPIDVTIDASGSVDVVAP